MPSQILLFGYKGVPEKIENWLKSGPSAREGETLPEKELARVSSWGKDSREDREKRELSRRRGRGLPPERSQQKANQERKRRAKDVREGRIMRVRGLAGGGNPRGHSKGERDPKASENE